MNTVYDTELISDINKNEIFLAGESLINHNNNRQIWLLGIINNRNKQFRIVGTLSREGTTLKKIIEKFIFRGNTIVTDHWQGYNWLDSKNSGYHHISFNCSLGNFGAGVLSTSHIKAVWNIIKSKIKNSYYVIPKKNLFGFI